VSDWIITLATGVNATTYRAKDISSGDFKVCRTAKA
jgi:hypothetical protein